MDEVDHQHSDFEHLGKKVPIPAGADADTDARAYLVDVLVQVGNGDRQAFNDLYGITSAKLFGICFHQCRDRQAAEDALHDVYLAIWKNARRWDAERGSPITWMTTIARNRSIDWWRSERIRQTSSGDVALEIPDHRPNAETSTISAQTDQILHRCLSGLEPRKRDAIREAFFEGATYAELAERSGVPLGTMKAWIRRGLQQMHVQLLHLDQSP